MSTQSVPDQLIKGLERAQAVEYQPSLSIRLTCRLLGHKWGLWSRDHPVALYWRCMRCGGWEDKSPRTCPTYNYWHDLVTDLRKPESWLDLANMVLRRLRLVLVKTVDGDEVTWRLRSWLAFLDEIHEQGRCGACGKL